MIAKWRVYQLGRLGEQVDYGFVIASAENMEWMKLKYPLLDTACDIYERFIPETQEWVRHKFYKDGVQDYKKLTGAK